MNWVVEAARAFLRGVSRSRVSTVGAVLVTVLFPALLLGTLLDIWGMLNNPYFGFIIYLVMGPLFIVGLILVFVGLLFFQRRDASPVFSFEFFRKQLESPDRFERVRWVVVFVVFLTVLNVVIVSLFSYTGFHYTESVAFCGQFCHSVMHPEYTAYQNSPHSRVKCVECHIGEGAKWFAKSKISGARQFFAVAFNTFNRPIQTPVHGLRPARDTCEECHRPQFFFGEKLYVKHKYLPDEVNTEVQTVLLMKVGSGGGAGHRAHGIHWHVAEENRIVYKHSDWGRQDIFEVRMTDESGEEVVFKTDEAASEDAAAGKKGEGPWTRVMDCIDCHNRPTHIYRTAEDALNYELFTGEIPRDLPFIKRQALEVVADKYETSAEAKQQIAERLKSWYEQEYGDLIKTRPELLEKAIAGVQKAFSENVFPEMKIYWDTYPNFLGHPDYSGGCFRCHDDEHQSEDGRVISGDCDLCHVVLAEDEPNPEILGFMQATN